MLGGDPASKRARASGGDQLVLRASEGERESVRRERSDQRTVARSAQEKNKKPQAFFFFFFFKLYRRPKAEAPDRLDVRGERAKRDEHRAERRRGAPPRIFGLLR